MRQLKILELIWLLIKMPFKKGNDVVYYHCCYHDSYDIPLEVEGIEVRETKVGDKITVY